MPTSRFVLVFLTYFLYSLCTFVATASPTSSTLGNASLAHTVSSSVYPNATIELSSALQIEASASLEIERLASVPAVPIPTNITEYPQYDAVREIAPVMAPVQRGITVSEKSDLVADLMPSSNTSDTKNSLSARQSPMRILIVGDSITHGQQGDYTWRYRIWQWLRSNGISFQIVGPYEGTKSPPPPTAPQFPPLYGSPPDNSFTTDGGYARDVDSEFLSSSNHFAVWGRAAAVDKDLIQGVVQENPADLMLLMLGFNDLGWFYSDVGGTLASIQALITNARSANPDMKFAVANIPHRDHLDGRDDLVQMTTSYNNQLPTLLSDMSQTNSPIHLVDIAGTYACQDSGCPAGYDGLHPNAWGEYQIASAFSETLVNDFNLGSSPLAVPDQNDPSLERNLPVPSNIRAFSSPQGVTVTWDAVYGAYSYDVEAAADGVTATFSPGTVQSNRWDSQWPLAGWVYTVSVRAAAGNRKSAYTSSVSAEATPELPPEPENIDVQATANGARITWDPPTGGSTGTIVGYNILYWDWKWDHCSFLSGAAFKSSPAVLDNLTPGRNYAIWLVTWNENGQGLPAGSFNVIPGAGTPPVPSGLDVRTNDPVTVFLSWIGSDSAGGYKIWYRNVNEEGSQLEQTGSVTTSSSTCNVQTFLYPGAWNYAFSVSAFNGNDESDKAAEVIAPSLASTVTIGAPGETCPPEPSWCPSGGSVSVPPVGGGSTTVIGGTTSVISGSTTVIGGTTTEIGGVDPTTVPGGAPTTTGGPVPTGYPVVTNGRCTGPDCEDGECTGLLCASFGCTGDDCFEGVCTGSDCTPSGCLGPNCVNGFCRGLGCLTGGCLGEDCEGGGGGGGGSGHCVGLDCISVGCSGSDCVGGGGGGGGCTGPNCSVRSCTGSNCYSGSCAQTNSCTPYGGAQGGGSNAPDDQPDDECTTSSRYPTCTSKLVVVTSDYADLSSTTTSTSTSTTCYTITACIGSATTIATTTETATTITAVCEPTSCGNACRRAKARAVSPSDTPPKLDKPATPNDYVGSNLTVLERDLPGPGSGDWGQWYRDLKDRDETIVVDNYDGVLDTNTAVTQVRWGTTPQNIVVENLQGCYAVLCASHLGAFVAHFWENPSMRSNFQADVIDILEAYLGSSLTAFWLGLRPACYVMAGTRKVIASNTPEDQETLTRSAEDPLQYPDKAAQIEDRIRSLLGESAYTQTIRYVRQVNRNILQEQDTGYGNAAVLFDPSQRAPPNGDIDFPPGYGTVAVYVQGYKAIQEYWPYQEFQIWRAHPREGQTANVVVQVDRNTVQDPCQGDVDPPNIISSEVVSHGSEVTDVGPEVIAGEGGDGQPFDLVDSAGTTVSADCVFRGGDYAPTADDGPVAGELTCANDEKWQCTRPYYNLATTCGGMRADRCGTLGEDCPKFYQLLATCRL